MSHGVTTDVVPFQAYLGHGEQMKVSLLQKLCEPQCWLECQEEEPEVFLLEANGWQYDAVDSMDRACVHFGKKDRMYGYPWTKGDFRVYCWNSSQYSNGGDLEGSVAADDRASIEAFIADFKDDLDLNGFAGSIVEDDTCEWWG